MIPSKVQKLFSREPALPCSGWAASSQHTLHKTKKSVLISYDLLALRGLKETERYLAQNGMGVVRSQMLCDSKSKCWSAAVKGELSQPMAEFSVTSDCKFRTFAAALHWLDLEYRDSLTEADRQAMGDIVWSIDVDSKTWQPKDGRRRRTFRRNLILCAEIFDRFSITFHAVRIQAC
jgi:hypothetical protein